MTSRRKRYEKHHALAAEGVLAYLRDEDADLSNITDAAVAEDALAAAWNLTALAAASVALLAERTGVTPELHSQRLSSAGTAACSALRNPRRRRGNRKAKCCWPSRD